MWINHENVREDDSFASDSVDSLPEMYHCFVCSELRVTS
jgi:hypothetical protein